MPGLIKSPADERKFARAKKLTRKSYPHLKGDKFWAAVNSLYGKIKEAASFKRLLARFAEGGGTSSYAWTDPKGGKHLPIGDASHVRNALARFGQTHFTSAGAARSAWNKIISAAKRFGIKHEGPMPTPKITAEPASILLAGIDDGGIAMCTVAIPDGTEAPEWIELIPSGNFSAVDGRGPFENNDPFSVVTASIAKMPQVGLVLDYDHSTDLAAPEGRPAPAAGWIKGFKVEGGAIFARIEWTKAAAEGLKEKLYRYISPVFEHSKDGKVERILRAALTNNPALVSLPAIAAAEVYAMAEGGKKEKLSDKVARFEAALGEDADDHQIMKHVMMELDPDPDSDGDGDEGNDGHAEPDGDEHAAQYAAPAPTPGADPYANESAEAMAARQSDEMAKCASDEEKATCASRHAAEKERFARRAEMARKPPEQMSTQREPEKLVVRPAKKEVHKPKAPEMTEKEISAMVASHPMMVRAMEDLNRIQQEKALEAATRKVDDAIREGRLIPAHREWAIEHCSTNPEAFAKFIGSQPRIIQAGADGKFTGQIGEPQPNQLDKREAEICANLGGISPEKFIAAKQARLSYNVHLDD